MAETTDNGITYWDTDPTGAAGLAINNNWQAIVGAFDLSTPGDPAVVGDLHFGDNEAATFGDLDDATIAYTGSVLQFSALGGFRYDAVGGLGLGVNIAPSTAPLNLGQVAHDVGLVIWGYDTQADQSASLAVGSSGVAYLSASGPLIVMSNSSYVRMYSGAGQHCEFYAGYFFRWYDRDTGILRAAMDSATGAMGIGGYHKSNSQLFVYGPIGGEESVTPADPVEGDYVLWLNTLGDFQIKINNGGTTKTATLVDFSTL